MGQQQSDHVRDKKSHQGSNTSTPCKTSKANVRIIKKSCPGQWKYPRTVFIGGLILVFFVAYLIWRGYDILNQSKLDDEITWYDRILSVVFNMEPTTRLSVTDPQFYAYLYTVVIEDFYSIYYITYQLLQDGLSIFNFFLFIPHYVAIVCVILACVWFTCLGIWKKKITNQLQNQNISTVNGCDCDRVVYIRSVWSLWPMLCTLVLFAFLISIPWEFIRLYQHRVAEKISATVMGIPDECKTYNLTYTQHIKSFLRWYLSWAPDICVQYHKAVYADPLYEVNPAMAITSVISNCIVYPFEIMCASLGRGFKEFFSNIPAQWQPIMLAMLVILLIIFLTMLFSYELNLFGLKLKPETPIQLQAIEKKERKKTKIKALKNSKESNTCQKQLTN